MINETWLPVVGYEGLYSVSDHGRVRSEQRTVAAFRGGSKTCEERILKAERPSSPYSRVRLWSKGVVRDRRVHSLVMEAFVGPRPDGMEVLHWDDNGRNNVLSNLRYGTHAENGLDLVRNHPECRNGHEWTEENTRIRTDTGHRQCRKCVRKRLADNVGDEQREAA